MVGGKTVDQVLRWGLWGLMGASGGRWGYYCRPGSGIGFMGVNGG